MTEPDIKISTGGVVIHDDEEFTADRDMVLKKMMARDVIKHDNSHLGGIDAKSTRVGYWSEIYNNSEQRPAYYSDFKSKTQTIFKDSIELVILPSWGVIFPPYNIARLSGLLRSYDYQVNVTDININSYRYFNQKKIASPDEHHPLWWDSNKTEYWVEEQYWEHIHESLKPVIDRHVAVIAKRRPNIVGLSVYWTNLQPSMYFVHQLKLQCPDVTVVVGGPGAFDENKLSHEQRWYGKQNNTDMLLFDYAVTGEGEQELLTLMENYRSAPKSTATQIYGGFKGNLDLNKLPFPDYDDYDLSWYDYSDGVSLETSRGCVAKCTFCSETHFWKFRWREPNRVVEEMKYQYNKYGTRRFWFVDSLVNGNMKEFKDLVDGIIESGMRIRWNSYARCDGRMELDFFHKLKQSGCMSLSFGLESGSQQVLDSMKKNVKIESMIANLRDSRIAGVNCHGNWIVGFPSEHNVHAAQSLQFLWNIRNDLYAISPGFGCGIAQFSDIEANGYKNYQIVDVNNSYFEDEWYTEDYRNTILHRSLRIKFMAIFLDLMKDNNSYVLNTQSYKNIKDFYNIEFVHDTPNEFVEQKDANFDYFTDSMVDTPTRIKYGLTHEYIAFVWALYSVFGAFKLDLSFDKERDMVEFGPSLTHDYNVNFSVEVDAQGNMNFDLDHEYTERAESDMRTGPGQHHAASFASDTVSFRDINLHTFVSNRINILTV